MICPKAWTVGQTEPPNPLKPPRHVGQITGFPGTADFLTEPRLV